MVITLSLYFAGKECAPGSTWENGLHPLSGMLFLYLLGLCPQPMETKGLERIVKKKKKDTKKSTAIYKAFCCKKATVFYKGI